VKKISKKIKIITDITGCVEAELLEEKNPVTVNAIWKALPFNSRAQTWGDEIYFSIPVKLNEENAKSTVEFGDIGYWPPGQGFCIFFGPTPISSKNEIRPANPVNVFGKLKNDPTIFKKVKSGDSIRIEKK
jgi:hypothetical protein